MAATLFRSSTRAALRSGASATPRAAGLAGLTQARGKATLPDLSCKCFAYYAVWGLVGRVERVGRDGRKLF